MDKAHPGITKDYDTYISRALATEGGHLSIGRGGLRGLNSHIRSGSMIFI